MAYEPKTWVTGEVIKADDLNHIENGIGALYIPVTKEGNVKTLSASYNDIIGALNAGKFVAILDVSAQETLIKPCLELALRDGLYIASFGDSSSDEEYVNPSADAPLIYESLA